MGTRQIFAWENVRHSTVGVNLYLSGTKEDSPLFFPFFPHYTLNLIFRFCFQPKGFVNSSKNAQIKYIYNQNKIEGSGNAAVHELSSCCHPTKMKSLTIRYIRSDGIAVTTVLPNMIVTECGCS